MATQQGGTARRVGELAAATGLTVRTLHYHEEIGLLVPSGRTGTGHRRYDDADVARLYRICLVGVEREHLDDVIGPHGEDRSAAGALLDVLDAMAMKSIVSPPVALVASSVVCARSSWRRRS